MLLPAGIKPPLGGAKRWGCGCSGGRGRGQGVAGKKLGSSGGAAAAREPRASSLPECRDVLLPLLIDQLSGQLDDNSSKPDHEASSQLLSNILEVLDRKDVVS